MKITYIHHSSFLVELADRYLLFDYFEGDLPNFHFQKPIYSYSSHRHGDHFSSQLFTALKGLSVTYLLSDDIPAKQIPADCLAPVHWLTADQSALIDGIQIKTHRSNDEGLAFLLTVDQICFFHAGDLNHWYWPAEPAEWNQAIALAYQKELAKLQGELIDIAFLPLDPRLQTSFHLGIDHFMTQVGAKYVFPMHLWGDFDTIKRFKALPCTDRYRDQIIEIKQKGDSYDIS